MADLWNNFLQPWVGQHQRPVPRVVDQGTPARRIAGDPHLYQDFHPTHPQGTPARQIAGGLPPYQEFHPAQHQLQPRIYAHNSPANAVRVLVQNTELERVASQLSAREKEVFALKSHIESLDTDRRNLQLHLQQENTLRHRTAQEIELLTAENKHKGNWLSQLGELHEQLTKQLAAFTGTSQQLDGVKRELEAAHASLAAKDQEIQRLEEIFEHNRHSYDTRETDINQQHTELENKIKNKEKEHLETIKNISQQLHIDGRVRDFVLHHKHQPHAWETSNDPKATKSLELINETELSNYEPITHNDLKAMVGFYIRNTNQPFQEQGYEKVRTLLRKKIEHNIKEAEMDRKVLIVFSEIIEYNFEKINRPP